MSTEKQSDQPLSWLQLSDGPPEPATSAEKPSDRPLSWLQGLSHAPPTWLELQSIVPMATVRKMTTLSDEAINRNHSHRVKQLSARRKGMTLKDVLAIINGE